MEQMYKVFFDQKQIFIVEDSHSSIVNGTKKHLFQTKEILAEELDGFFSNDIDNQLLIVSASPSDVMNSLKELFEYRVAAGGLVRDNKGRVLMIFRKGKWDLPKGHMDPGETPEQTAVRETIEETGVKDPLITTYIGDTWHFYYLKNRLILKQSLWYEMTADSSSPLKPQVEEDITETKWADPLDLPHLYKNTYLSIAELLTSYFSETKR
jgi:8-oxo-dGTP pyrophosphatase MutT (NUDIX family)